MIYFWIIISFFIGSIPFGVLVAKTFKGLDPRKEGSGNSGATNVARIAGLPLGILTLACDILKGVLPVLIGMYLTVNLFLISVVALSAILGHIRSPFLGWRGGKGVATTIGALLPLAFWPLLCAAIICILVLLLSGYVSVGSLTVAVSLPILYIIFGQWSLLPLAFVLLGLIFWTHRDNIQRLAVGKEKNWRKKDS